MAEDPRPPVAIRITRPYGNEDEFLEHELETLTRTSVTLLGAQARPQGVVLRFELVLSSGQAILRGEGRVVGFKPNVLHGLGGLTLRFTRLDSRSKALVDKAAAARERRRPSHAPPSEPPRTQSVPPAPPQAPAPAPPPSAPLRDSVPPDLPSVDVIPVAPASAPSEPHPPVSAAPRSIPPPLPPRALKQNAQKLSVTPPPPRVATRGPLEAPPARDELLERLRARAKRLDAGEVERILSQRKRA